MAYLLFEFSTPLMNARYLLLALKRGGDPLFMRVSLSCMLVFFGVRLCWGGPVSVAAVRSLLALILEGRVHSGFMAVGFAVGNTGLNCLNLYWFSLMVRTLLKTHKKQK